MKFHNHILPEKGSLTFASLNLYYKNISCRKLSGSILSIKHDYKKSQNELLNRPKLPNEPLTFVPRNKILMIMIFFIALEWKLKVNKNKDTYFL